MDNAGGIALAFLISLGIVLLTGSRGIALLGAWKARQPVSSDAPASHQAKQGTPTMGGLLIVAAATLSTLVMAWMHRGSEISQTPLLAVAAVFVLSCGIGVLDDLGKARKKANQAGLSERVKLALQVIVAAGFLMFIATAEQARITSVILLAGREIDLGVGYYVLGVLYICGFGNAVNFTDGLDGLAAGTTLIAALTLAGLVALTGGGMTADVYLFYGALAGACAGFLWFNAHPARVFMGDTGSLPLGMGLAAAAIVAKQEVLLLIVGAVYLLEIGSMMIQRYVFKWRRIRRGLEYARAHRVFRRAPLHHHFEELGWPETHVVARFWIIALLAAAAGAALAPYVSAFTPMLPGQYY